MDARRTFVQLRQAAGQIAESVIVATLWLVLGVQAIAEWLVTRWLAVPRRQHAQGTIEILIAMAVLGVLALAVWRVIGPAVMDKATGVATDLQTSGTGPTGTGN